MNFRYLGSVLVGISITLIFLTVGGGLPGILIGVGNIMVFGLLYDLTTYDTEAHEGEKQ